MDEQQQRVPVNQRPLTDAERAAVLRTLAAPSRGWADLEGDRARAMKEKRWHSFTNERGPMRQDVVTGTIEAKPAPSSRRQRRTEAALTRRASRKLSR